MANVISDETMEYVGILAKLELSKEEQKAATQESTTPAPKVPISPLEKFDDVFA